MATSKKKVKNENNVKEQPSPKDERYFNKIPLWGWFLIFILPLVFSEYMFYVVGKWFNMIVFPVAWVGFWLLVMYLGGWPIFIKK